MKKKKLLQRRVNIVAVASVEWWHPLASERHGRLSVGHRGPAIPTEPCGIVHVQGTGSGARVSHYQPHSRRSPLATHLRLISASFVYCFFYSFPPLRNIQEGTWKVGNFCCIHPPFSILFFLFLFLFFFGGSFFVVGIFIFLIWNCVR